jgi:hypothetical protein
MAALAVLLIVGSALAAGLLAVRMDNRVPVLAARGEIAPGSKIAVSDLKVVDVAGDGLELIDKKFASDVVGTYATTRILPNQLINQEMLTRHDPISSDRAVVNMVLSPSRAPIDDVESGDVVQVVATSEDNRSGGVITEAYVLSVSLASKDDLTGDSAGTSVQLLVPRAAAATVVDASAQNRAGLAVLSHGNDVDVDLGVTTSGGKG